jgi:hypothetical protein
MSKTRTKINNSLIASKIDIDYKNINSTKKQMEKQLSQKEFHTLYQEPNNQEPIQQEPIQQEPIQQEPTIYHMESLYRDNICDKYELIKNIYE